MASLQSLFHPFAFFLLSVLAISPCLHADHGVEFGSHHVVSIASILSEEICSPSKDLGHSSLKLVHRYGPCSPLNHTLSPTAHQQILTQDQIRVDWLRRKASAASQPSLAASKIPIQTGTSVHSGNYIATVGFGTPALQQSVFIDTGSDVTWIQCKPCSLSCYQQNQPLFDPSRSSTYRNVTCSSPSCSALQSRRCSSSGTNCIYIVNYGDQSYTVGLYAQDTLSLTSSDVVPNFQFGCGQNNNGLFGMAAGLAGLGRGPASLTSQTSRKYGGAFSYCLPSTSSNTGYLTFGARSASPNIQFTPMLAKANMPTFYFVELMAISVGGKQLSISPTLFSNAGTLIDSGTVITRLPPSAYSVLRSAFRQGMSSRYTLTPGPASSILDTCYDFTGVSTVSIPTVALQFKGATANLGFSNIMYQESGMQFCLAFAANGDDGGLVIIGNTQQRGFNVVYDLSKKMIGFGPGGC